MKFVVVVPGEIERQLAEKLKQYVAEMKISPHAVVEIENAHAVSWLLAQMEKER